MDGKTMDDITQVDAEDAVGKLVEGSVVVVIDFGSQYSHLIVRRFREINIYSQLRPFDVNIEEIKLIKPAGVVLSGGPASVYRDDAPHLSYEFWEYIKLKNIPLLGICYGLQEIVWHRGGSVVRSIEAEYGRSNLKPLSLHSSGAPHVIFKDLTDSSLCVWMSHADKVSKLPEEFEVIATTDNSEYGCISHVSKNIVGLQFHPEVSHTDKGNYILFNFATIMCNIQPNWDMSRFAPFEIERVKGLVGDRWVLGGLSGGVDSSVAAMIVYRAIGDRFKGVIVDNGLMRKNEAAQVFNKLKQCMSGVSLTLVDASQNFMKALEGLKHIHTHTHRETLIRIFLVFHI
eukprot:GHVR01078397.1.p1 GENE.GHVR01078397.1~~GHVR01078397.1.p1  ORF type:complete len:344 (+),score=94.78 GHVR01078397.1:74-1105(+)